MQWILLVVGLTVAFFIVRYVISLVVHKGADAISNAIVDKKNKTQPQEPENLADRYKDVK